MYVQCAAARSGKKLVASIVRKIFALCTGLCVALIGLLFIFIGEDQWNRDRSLVKNEYLHFATVVEVNHVFRRGNEYVVVDGGKRFTISEVGALNEGGPIEGDLIKYVVDPTNSSYTVAVGNSDYWEPRSTGHYLALGCFEGLFALFGGFLTWKIWTPEQEEVSRSRIN